MEFPILVGDRAQFRFLASVEVFMVKPYFNVRHSNTIVQDGARDPGIRNAFDRKRRNTSG